MSTEGVVVAGHVREWETWPPEQAAQRGEVFWKTLISAGVTSSDSLTLGVARVPPGAMLRPHRHAPAEVYLVLEGEGVVTIDGTRRPVRAGAAVFLPGDALHAIECTGPAELRFAYAFAVDAFEDVEYVFGD